MEYMIEETATQRILWVRLSWQLLQMRCQKAVSEFIVGLMVQTGADVAHVIRR